MKQFLINLLGILYILIFFITAIATIACLICFSNTNFPKWLFLSIPLFIICVAALPPLGKYLTDNKFMENK